MEIRPIKTEADYQTALQELDQLLDAEPGTRLDDRLEVLSTLVWVYEEEHYPIPDPDPIEFIKYQMECRDLSKSDLEPYIGSRERVAQVLTRRRALSLSMIRKLHAGLDIPADILVQPYKLRKSSSATRTHSR